MPDSNPSPPSPSPPSPEFSTGPTHAMGCTEIWGGNAARHTALSTPGLDVWVNSEPYEHDDEGGDIYYASMCAAGCLARFALADVAGHGHLVAQTATALRHMMRKNINTIDQTRFARRLNTHFAEIRQSLTTDNKHTAAFATAILTAYYAPTDDLVLVNAGHPRPFYYSATRDDWCVLDPNSGCFNKSQSQDLQLTHTGNTTPGGIGNLPLGIIDPLTYQQFALTLDKGDLIVIYTDAFTEARNPDGQLLLEDGFLKIVRHAHRQTPHRPDLLSDVIISAVDAYRHSPEPDDDQTLIVMHHNAADPPKQSLGEKLHTVAKMMGLAKV